MKDFATARPAQNNGNQANYSKVSKQLAELTEFRVIILRANFYCTYMDGLDLIERFEVLAWYRFKRRT